MRTLIDAALHHSRTTLSALLLILIAGTVAYVELPTEADPDVNIPIISVLLRHEGISPEDAERLLLRPVEPDVRSIAGGQAMRLPAYADGATLGLAFAAGVDAAAPLAASR